LHFVAQSFSFALSRPKGMHYITPCFDANKYYALVNKSDETMGEHPLGADEI